MKQAVNIIDLLPQRHPFIMLDRMLHFDPIKTITALVIRKDNIFLDNGVLSEAGIIENMAQTCAARMGYISKELDGGTVKLGFIGSMKNMEIHRLPEENEEIITEINVLEEVFQMTLVSISVQSTKGQIATGEMKISITDIDKLNE
ncbi:MAG: pseudouridylate synthase [Tannerellaceae bacterium]|jgi:predicted hotdog family 3-hydroxylacyl-ACP dehydratase|nr:pseudouridylate synthase [Tannerellaceae bacterium]